MKAILDTYYPDDRDLVKDVVYTASDRGLTTDSVDSPTARGTIHVGRYFVEHATQGGGFARRVLQVMHELEHVRQHRRGMGGPAKKDEREFLAFRLEATAREARGTGNMDPGTRILLIDAALRHYNCLADDAKERYRSQQAELLTLRRQQKIENGGRGGDAPTGCGPD